MANVSKCKDGGSPAPDFPTTGIHAHVARILRTFPLSPGSVVVDVPAGDGRVSALLLAMGVKVIPLDLFPKTFQVPGLNCGFADMTRGLPLQDASVDLIVCEEGIEHVPDQLSLLTEFNRILKVGGTLLLTTPNTSQLRSRLSTLLVGSELWKRLPPSEIDGVWFAGKDRFYYGHLFLLGANQLWVLSRIAGFDLAQKVRTDLGTTSLLLAPLLGPLLLAAYLFAFLTGSRRLNPSGKERLRDLLRKQAAVNLSPKSLFCKHLFWVLEKRVPFEERRNELLENSSSSGWHHSRVD